jgi:hypothetical protein
VAEPKILARLKAAEARERDLSTPSALTGLINPGRSVAQSWAAAPMSARREVARMLLSHTYLGEMLVKPSPTPGERCPVDDRIQWRRSTTEV